jgi:synaptobrevin family protein YKT6
MTLLLIGTEFEVIINKMRLVSIHIYKQDKEACTLLCSEMDLNMLWFYQRGMAREHITFATRLVAGRCAPGTKASISLEDNMGMCYCWTTTDGITATVCCDHEYPERAAFIMLNKLMMEFRDKFQGTGVIEGSKENGIKFAPLEKYL